MKILYFSSYSLSVVCLQVGVSRRINIKHQNPASFLFFSSTICVFGTRFRMLVDNTVCSFVVVVARVLKLENIREKKNTNKPMSLFPEITRDVQPLTDAAHTAKMAQPVRGPHMVPLVWGPQRQYSFDHLTSDLLLPVKRPQSSCMDEVLLSVLRCQLTY